MVLVGRFKHRRVILKSLAEALGVITYHQNGAAGGVHRDAVPLLLGEGHQRGSLPGERGSAQGLETGGGN